MIHSIIEFPYLINATPNKRGSIPASQKALIWEFSFGRCWYCGTGLNPFGEGGYTSRFCVDHVIPLCRGGFHDLRNFVPCCVCCNQRKGTMLLDEWRENFARSKELDEEPWIDASGVFWFERDEHWIPNKEEEIRCYLRFVEDGEA